MRLSPAKLTPLTSGTLIGLLLALSYYQITQASRFNPVVFCLQALPLLIILPGLIKGHRRAYQWCGFIVLLYFLRGIILISSPQPQWIDYLLVIASITLFILSLLGSRCLIAPHQKAPHDPRP